MQTLDTVLSVTIIIIFIYYMERFRIQPNQTVDGSERRTTGQRPRSRGSKGLRETGKDVGAVGNVPRAGADHGEEAEGRLGSLPRKAGRRRRRRRRRWGRGRKGGFLGAVDGAPRQAREAEGS